MTFRFRAGSNHHTSSFKQVSIFILASVDRRASSTLQPEGAEVNDSYAPARITFSRSLLSALVGDSIPWCNQGGNVKCVHLRRYEAHVYKSCTVAYFCGPLFDELRFFTAWQHRLDIWLWNQSWNDGRRSGRPPSYRYFLAGACRFVCKIFSRNA